MKSLIDQFEDGSINIREFNHKQHLYIAWYYLGLLPFQEALNRYVKYLRNVLELNGQIHRFNLLLTESYFNRLDTAMKLHPTSNFEELLSNVDLK